MERSIYLTNLPNSVTYNYLNSFIKAKGPHLEIENILITIDYEEKVAQKKAFVVFSSEEEASIASVLLHHEQMRNCKISAFSLS